MRTDVLSHQIYSPLPPNHPQPHFGGHFNAKPIIERALRKSHVNGATKLKLYSYIGIGKYLEECGVSTFYLLRASRGRRAHNVNLGPPIILETTRARKLNLKIPLDMVKYPLWVQQLLYYRPTIQHEGGRHIDFLQTSIFPGQTTANNCKTAFSLHVAESASDDYNF